MTVTDEQRVLLENHLRMVIEENQRTNITRIDTWDEGWLLHVEDSLAGIDEVADAIEGPLADLGSGAGFPGSLASMGTCGCFPVAPRSLHDRSPRHMR